MGSKATIKTSSLILSFVLLAGVIALAYGYYNSSSFIIIAGLTVIFIISLMLPLQNILDKNETKKKLRLNKLTNSECF